MLPTPAPAQVGAVPGPTALVVGLSTLLVPLALAVWVGHDATEHSDHPLAWALATLLAGVSPLWIGSIAVLLLYRRTRDELGSIAPPSVRRETEIDRGEVLGEAVDERRRAAYERGADEQTADRQSADRQTADGKTADEQTADGGSSEGENGDTDGSSADGLGGFELADPVEE